MLTTKQKRGSKEFFYGFPKIGLGNTSFFHFHQWLIYSSISIRNILFIAWKLKCVPLQNQSVHPCCLKLVLTLREAWRTAPMFILLSRTCNSSFNMMEKVLLLKCCSLQPLACHLSKQHFLPIFLIQPTSKTLRKKRKTHLPVISNQCLLWTLTAL